LSTREVEVIGLVVQGHSTTEIAKLLILSPDTIKTHLKNIFRKCQVHSRAELTAWWYKKEALSAASGNTSRDRGEQAPAKTRRSKLTQIALAAAILVAVVIPVSPALDSPQTIVTPNVAGWVDVAQTHSSDAGLEPNRRGAAVCEQMGRDTGANDSSDCVPGTAP
jgi:DNA-binding CsgD family transcriptional regulator